ncbi:carbohydrate kinase [Rhizobium leguminosarum bv. viciae]|uniref:PfkB family carbohydrate kinase n=1 Tax=Rhizobium leguminosarum TaxID=384 RepID=UPI001441423A|nr:PfkB family carbohydrate kinase [Rhizobium leguminosarum]NKK99813.1 carbohydrate kinase [Rhizobium leguminosarum bv. viciae]
MTTSTEKPSIFGTGLIALDLVIGVDSQAPVHSWTGGTCGNILAIMSYLGWDAYPIARMNGDPASERVRVDLARWDVHLDFTDCAPTGHTPIIIQQIKRARDGSPTHRFLWTCPHCGQRLPSYRPVTQNAIEGILPALSKSSVFFLDRVSRAAISLATEAARSGAIVVFEPSGKSDEKLFEEALHIAHVVKYSDQRLSDAGGAMTGDRATLLEIQTLGSEGLRYRHRLTGDPSDWLTLPALRAPRLVDTCGSGDWCTAGLLVAAASKGVAGLMQIGEQDLASALRYGQALAAWNCGFEGARGGMYALDRQEFARQIDAIISGKPLLRVVERPQNVESSVACPACPRDISAA